MNDEYSAIYSQEALNDLRNIYSYIAYQLKSPDIALKQVNRIREKIRSLAYMPMRYPVVNWEPWKSLKMHKSPIDNYVIFYLINPKTMVLSIVRIFYAKEDIENHI